MGKRIQIEPAWLVSLLNQWALHDLRSQTGSLGYASGSSWMRGLKSSPSSSIDPTGYAARDFRDVEAAMEDLMVNEANLWASVAMYYKPWVVVAFREEGYPFNNSTFYDRLHKAHGLIVAFMANLKDKRRADLEKLGLSAV